MITFVIKVQHYVCHPRRLDPHKSYFGWIGACSEYSKKSHQILKLKCFLYPLAVVFAQPIEARCSVDNEDVVGAAPTGDAPTTSELSTIAY